MAEAWRHQRKVTGYAFDLFGDGPDLELFTGSLYADARCAPGVAPAPYATLELSRSHGPLTLTSAGVALCRSADQAFNLQNWGAERD